jgi:hypothetical protein
MTPPDRPARKPRSGIKLLCLGGCGHHFLSRDPIHNRICSRCNARNQSYSIRERAPSRPTVEPPPPEGPVE